MFARNFGQNSVIILKNSVLLKKVTILNNNKDIWGCSVPNWIGKSAFLRQCYKVLRVSKVLIIRQVFNRQIMSEISEQNLLCSSLNYCPAQILNV